MDIITRRRQQVQWTIQQNPTSITINRTQKTEIEGHLDEVKTQVGPLIVRIFTQRSLSTKVKSELAGTKQTDNAWGLLADYQADLLAGPRVTDEFDCSLGHFRLVDVYPEMMNGQIVGYQADLEKVS